MTYPALRSFFRHKATYVLLILFVVAVLIKFYNAPYFATYNAEVGQHYLEIIKLLTGQLLLEGPLTSHDWLRLSATPYYFFFPLFILTKFHPLTLPLLWTITSTVTLFINFFMVKKIWNRETALLSSVIYVFSPNILLLDHNSGFFPFIIPLMYLLLLQTYRVFKHESEKVWTLFLFISLMFTLHASAIMLLPFFVGFAFFVRVITKRTMLTSSLAFLIPQLPLILNDITNEFISTTHLALWIPYKVVNFLSGKTYGVEKAVVEDNSLLFIIDFFKLSILPPTFPWWTGFLIVIPLLCYLFVLLKRRQFSFDIVLLLLLFYGSVALFIHKNPPHHYFVPLVILPIILLAHFLQHLIAQRVGSAIFSLLFLSTLLYIFSPNYLFNSDIELPFATQKKIAQTIIADSAGQEYALRRIGPFDHYDDEFKENYIYLLWWLGNRPTDRRSLLYTINEKPSQTSSPSGEKLVEIEGTIILKSE